MALTPRTLATLQPFQPGPRSFVGGQSWGSQVNYGGARPVPAYANTGYAGNTTYPAYGQPAYAGNTYGGVRAYGNMSTVPMVQNQVVRGTSFTQGYTQAYPYQSLNTTQRVVAPAAKPAAPRPAHMFESIPTAPPDAILSLATRFKEDTFAKKVNLGIGAYRTETGKPWPLPVVVKAQELLCRDAKEDKEYVPIDGAAENKKFVQQLLFTDDFIDRKTVATSQTLSGTGALAVLGQFLAQYCKCKTIHMSDPTWGNHKAIFEAGGLTTKNYTYYHPPTRGFDFEGMVADMNKMAPGDIILLHSCAHNPTGVDPTHEQWDTIVEICKERQLMPLVDNAYQGYATGDLDFDGQAVKKFQDSGMEFCLAQSFAKNFGLYGERIGYCHVVCASPDHATAVLSQIKILIRAAYSSPPRHGASIVHRILSSPDLKAQWLSELKLMAGRIDKMRSTLRRALEKRGTPGTWNHITDQIGMFSYTGLTVSQCERLVNEFHIYLLKNGRVSMAGVNENCVEYIAEAMDTVVRES